MRQDFGRNLIQSIPITRTLAASRANGGFHMQNPAQGGCRGSLHLQKAPLEQILVHRRYKQSTLGCDGEQLTRDCRGWRQGFFHQNIGSSLERSPCDVRMRIQRCANVDDVWPAKFEHFARFGEWTRPAADSLRQPLRCKRIAIHHPADDSTAFPCVSRVPVPHEACADDRNREPIRHPVWPGNGFEESGQIAVACNIVFETWTIAGPVTM